MKEGWTYKKFKDICYSISDGDWIEKKDQSDSGIRLIQTGNIGVGVFIPKDESQKFISEETFKRLRCTEIFEGDILISRLPNPLGRSCLLPKLKTKCITAVDCSILRIKDDIVSPQFFVYYTQSQGYFSKINSESSGTTRARITRKKLEETDIPIPDLNEQQRIVSRLDSAFAHIDELKANAEKQLSEARGLFQKALTKAMEPKEGWEEKPFGDVGTFSRGINFSKSDFIEDGFPCIHYGQIHTRLGVVTHQHLTSIPPNLVRNDKLASKGDIIIAITSEDVEGSCKCTAWLGDYDIAVGAHAAIYKHSLNPAYVSYYMKSAMFQKGKEPYVHGFKVMEIKPSDIAKIPIVFPSAEEQRRIVSRLDSLSAHVRELEEVTQKTIAECDALKQALLRKVFE